MDKFKIILLLMLVSPAIAIAQDKIQLRTTTITGNKELPKILYIVPWKEVKQNKMAERKLVLHSLFGDLFDPVLPLQVK
ncbi:MAG: hypothetical protein KAU21_01570 [Gammaproteobacteria bacterium]|nr:hypothetical protein [Gammaproteobacteria bacterium]